MGDFLYKQTSYFTVIVVYFKHVNVSSYKIVHDGISVDSFFIVASDRICDVDPDYWCYLQNKVCQEEGSWTAEARLEEGCCVPLPILSRSLCQNYFSIRSKA